MGWLYHYRNVSCLALSTWFQVSWACVLINNKNLQARPVGRTLIKLPNLKLWEGPPRPLQLCASLNRHPYQGLFSWPLVCDRKPLYMHIRWTVFDEYSRSRVNFEVSAARGHADNIKTASYWSNSFWVGNSGDALTTGFDIRMPSLAYQELAVDASFLQCPIACWDTW